MNKVAAIMNDTARPDPSQRTATRRFNRYVTQKENANGRKESGKDVLEERGKTLAYE